MPFVFAANGRPFLKQIETESGIWFRDTRRAANQRRQPCAGFLQGRAGVFVERELTEPEVVQGLACARLQRGPVPHAAVQIEDEPAQRARPAYLCTTVDVFA